MGQTLTSVIVPARNAEATLRDTLAALGRQRCGRDYEVIVVDDGSADSTAVLAGNAPVVREVVRLEGRGPAAARNAGAAQARGVWLAFLDADCEPTPGWLAAGATALETADLVIGETRPRSDRTLGPFDRSLWVTGQTPLFESANLFVRRSLFERVGGFESWLGPKAGKELGEDVLFGWQALRAGARVAACPDALAYHEVYPRGALEFAAERWRLRYFPMLVRRIPELRRAAFHRGFFLTPRAARFDAALVSLTITGFTGRVVFAAGALPYGRLLVDDLRRYGEAGPVAGNVLADAVGFAAMLIGSARSRSLLI